VAQAKLNNTVISYNDLQNATSLGQLSFSLSLKSADKLAAWLYYSFSGQHTHMVGTKTSLYTLEVKNEIDCLFGLGRFPRFRGIYFKNINILTYCQDYVGALGDIHNRQFHGLYSHQELNVLQIKCYWCKLMRVEVLMISARADGGPRSLSAHARRVRSSPHRRA
jgi:hypothetical protein